MRIVLMRHAEAESGAALASDAERALTAHGRESALRIGMGLKRMGIVIDRLLTSPLVRARETAELAAQGLEFSGTIEETDALGFGFSVKAVLDLLLRGGADDVVMLVGHEPDMSRMTSRFLEREGRINVAFKKAAVCGIEFAGMPSDGGGTLLYFFRPKLLLKLLD